MKALIIGCVSLAIQPAGWAAETQPAIPLPDAAVQTMVGLQSGHDLAKLAAAMRRAPVRDQFESAADFAGRMDAFAQQPIYGTVSISDRIAITGPLARGGYESIFYKYDADSAKLKICLPMFDTLGAIPGRNTSVAKVVATSHTSKGSYLGQNAFGARVKVARADKRVTQVRVNHGPGSPDCMDAVDLLPAIARTKLSGSYWALLGRFAAPYIVTTSETFAATVKEPFEGTMYFENLTFEPDEVIAFTPSGEIFYRSPYRW